MIFHENEYIDVIDDLEEIILEVISNVFLVHGDKFEVSLVPIKNQITLMSILNIDGIKICDIYLEYGLACDLQLCGVIDKNGRIYLYGNQRTV